MEENEVRNRDAKSGEPKKTKKYFTSVCLSSLSAALTVLLLSSLPARPSARKYHHCHHRTEGNSPQGMDGSLEAAGGRALWAFKI